MFFFTFLDCGPILSEGPPGGVGGGRDADTHTHTYTYTYVSQSFVKTDLSQRSLGRVCMYMYVNVNVWNNAKMIKCNGLCPAVFLFRREEG